jgi:thymidylate kinase
MAGVVVLDRYVPDFIIDQSINSNLSPARMDRIKQTRFLNKFHFPDYTIIIDIPAAEGCFRKSDGTSIAHLELRVNYYKSIAGHNTLHLNGLENIDVLHSKIKKWVLQKIEVKNI